MNKTAESEGEVARCRRVREERDRRLGTLDAALRHFSRLELQGRRRPSRVRHVLASTTLSEKKMTRTA